jgi:vancomycin resistance protein YoaR
MYSVYPKVDSELLSDIRSIRIGRYITSFNPSNKKRSTNIKLAVAAINNHVVFPGETFSFNKVVGKRTSQKGYEKAKVIVRGEYAEDIGGGICQVSSTLFNAVDSAGLKIVQRFSHSRHVPYIPPGRDATVSWYGPDFEFKNIYNQPILIQARTLGNLLVIKLYSSEVIEYKPKEVPFPPLEKSPQNADFF